MKNIDNYINWIGNIIYIIIFFLIYIGNLHIIVFLKNNLFINIFDSYIKLQNN
jgi:hypothetical protein